MPGYLRGKTRDTYTLVVLNEQPLVYYAFYRKDYTEVTGISNNDFLSLGHVTGATPPAGSFTFLRAQAPKPARVKKILNREAGANEQISVSTFCSTNAFDTAQNDGWKITKRPRSVVLRTGRSVTAVAELSNGALYAYSLNATDYEAWRGELGLADSSTINTAAERARLVSGSSRPRPGIVSKPAANGSTQKTFVATGSEDAAERAGWTIELREYI